MNRRSVNLIGMVLLIAVLGIAALLLQTAKTDGKGSIAMLNIGQGDSFLITSPSGAQLLIDGGKDATVLSELAKVMPRGDRSIDVVIGTHPDADHIGGLGYVLDRYEVGLFLTSNVEGDTDIYRDLIQKVLDKHVPAYYLRRGMNLSLGDTAFFATLFPDRDVHSWETNTGSVVGRLQIGKRSALFTGDSPISIETYLARTYPKDLDVDILKLGHHGSKTSSAETFLRATSPALALISAGVRNRYGHPHQEVLERLTKFHIPWVSTQEKGTVILTTDGNQWVEQDLK